MSIAPYSRTPWSKELTHVPFHPPKLSTESSLYSPLYLTVSAYSGLYVTAFSVFSVHVFQISRLSTKSSAQAAITKYHRLGALSNRIDFLTVLEAGSLRSRQQLSRLVSVVAPLPGLRTAAFSPCPQPAFPLCVQGERG